MENYFESYEPVDESGAVAWSPFVDPEQVIEAYEHGVFPWPDREESIYWFSPFQRGILDFAEAKWSARDLRFFKKEPFVFRHNYDFEKTIRLCAQVKARQEGGTWITDDLIETYLILHTLGVSHSFEVYDKESEEMVGGVYGVQSKTYFSAESMFYLKPNASKYALFKGIEYLSQKGMSWIDTQVVTEFTSQIGAKEIPRDIFLQRIK